MLILIPNLEKRFNLMSYLLDKKIKILALATCHNRRKITIKSINSLKKSAFKKNIDLKIYIVDDGSIDGTSKEIKKRFKDVKIISGNGKLFWCKGMVFGYKKMIKNEKKFDFILSFNDDVYFYKNFLNNLLSTYYKNINKNTSLIVVGSTCDNITKKLNQGGLKKRSFINPLSLELIKNIRLNKSCDTFNMNCVLINQSVIKKIGFLSKNYRHIWGDWDYGLRNTKFNGLNIVASKIVGECPTPNNKMYISNTDDKILTTAELWKRYVHFGQQNPKERYKFYKDHGGLLWLFFYFGTYLKFWVINIFKINK